ncbi:MAG: M23 family metallopeptidase [Chitinophagaceae bacterium]|nr:M23 family metallopeptidase [Chitinophagaceae bacterium]MCB9044725.1 M23 family metallopeptidase [Chitinophagales bacterium]
MRQLILLILLLPFIVTAQEYPQGYFRNPLNIPIVLAGNFGECRSNHFHSGLDIKTESRENLPVYAAADGYVARIKMQKGGFGHALYLVHPNGYSTLYAHLNDFAPEIQEYMKAEQYRRKSWTVDLYIPASKFPVKKGDLIAYSGNTGGSTAPHLHFEIRDSRTENPVNPLLFGFDIKDNIPPTPYNVVFYDMLQSVYEQKPLFKTPKKKGNIYFIDTVIVSTPLIGIGIDEFDYMNDSKNTLTMYKGELYMDEEQQSEITIDNISYDITRYLHAFADYKTKREKDRWVQQFFLLPGNRLTHIYTQLNKMKGRLEIEDGLPHLVKMHLADALGNPTNIEFYVRYNGAEQVPNNCDSGTLFKVNKPNSFSHPNVKFVLDSKDLYDDVCFTFIEKPDANAYSARYYLHNTSVPVHSYFSLYIKPNKPVPFELRSKIALVEEDNNKDYGKAAVYDNGWYRASTRNFGQYRLVADNTPPSIIPMQSREALLKSSRITFKVNEDITSVDKFDATLDGQWVPFEQSGDVFFYTFDDHCPKGDHELIITAADENGNEETIKYSFKR